jgi:prepilin-type N-terminal cleavage/methylation domain-containing protein
MYLQNRRFHSRARKGFTLIELLVVLAIIGMLTSIISTSISAARNKGGDAAVKSNMRTVLTQAAIYFDTGNTYGTVYGANTCPTTGTTMFNADTIIKNAIAAGAAAGGGGTWCATSADGSSYAVSVQLKTSTNH